VLLLLDALQDALAQQGYQPGANGRSAAEAALAAH
jgi:ribosome modulation factor